MKMNRAGSWCAAISVGVLGLSGVSTSAEPQGVLSLAQAIDMALRGNPGLLASRYELTAAQARMLQSGLRLNPTLELSLENFAGSGAVGGTRSLETTLSLGQVIELGGKRALRTSVAEADYDLITIQTRARQLDLLAEVTRRFLTVATLQNQTQFAHGGLQLAQQTLTAVAARVAAARSPEAEATRARIAVTRAELQQQSMAAQLVAARVMLAAAWGSTELLFAQVGADLDTFAPLQSMESLSSAIEQNPNIAVFASEARLRDAELRLAQAQAHSNVGVSAGVRRLQSGSDSALVAGFSMPLRLYDKNQGAIREATVRRAQSTAEQRAAMANVRAILTGFYLQVTAAREQAQMLRQTAIPLAQTALEQTRTGFDRGRFSLLELLTAQQELLDLRAAEIAAASAHHLLLIDLERLTGASLTTDLPEAPLP
jgi:outer membrane protein, heavy metal efflux system